MNPVTSGTAVPEAAAFAAAARAVRSSKLELRAVGRKGRGVFAAAPIAAGELLETSPTVVLDCRDTDTIVGTTLDNYYFAHPADPDGGLLVLGFGSLLNHSDAPNAETRPRYEDGLGWLVDLHALRDVATGEELTRRYACELWFEPEPAG